MQTAIFRPEAGNNRAFHRHKKTPDTLRRRGHFRWFGNRLPSLRHRRLGLRRSCFYTRDLQPLPNADGERLGQPVEFGQRRNIGFMAARNRIKRVLPFDFIEGLCREGHTVARRQ